MALDVVETALVSQECHDPLPQSAGPRVQMPKCMQGLYVRNRENPLYKPVAGQFNDELAFTRMNPLVQESALGRSVFPTVIHELHGRSGIAPRLLFNGSPRMPNAGQSIRNLSYPATVSLNSTQDVFDHQHIGSSIPPHLPNVQAHQLQLVTANPEFIIQEAQDELAPTRDASLPSYPEADPHFIVQIYWLPSQPHLPLQHPPAIFIPMEDHTVSLNPSFSSSFPSNQYSPLGIHRNPNSAQVSTENLESGERKDSWKHIWEIFDKQELGKHILGFAVNTVVNLVLSSNSLSTTTDMRIVAVAASCAVPAIWNGVLFRKTYPRLSTVILVTGIALMMLAFFVFVSCYVPRELKWVPCLAWIATLFSIYYALIPSQNVDGEYGS